MASIHPPRPGEHPRATGQYHIVGPKVDALEEWELYVGSDGSSVLRADQQGVEFGQEVRRLGHVVVVGERVERLQLHQRTPAGVHRQTYTVYEDGVLVTDNRTPGRRMVDAPSEALVVGPLISLPLWLREERGRRPVLWVYAAPTGLLASAVGHVEWTLAGYEELSSPTGTQHCARWDLLDPWGNRHAVWTTDQGRVVRWEQANWTASLVAWREE